jgi:tRNA U34 5-methylaminomethyl-2-thiouridine-forming methyltransferase MnmC
MQRKLIVTRDGSHSIEIPELGVAYHSIHGAIRESMHVFIEAGLKASGRCKRPDAMQIFEVGFGTGLNALLTMIEAEKMSRKTYYQTIEPFPLDTDDAKGLNYCELLNRRDLQDSFEQLHQCEWEKEVTITSNFTFVKKRNNLLHFETPTAELFDLIYYDPFDPKGQPELWTDEIFKKLVSILRPGGILVTYSSKGSVRRAMQAAGFSVEKIPGPLGKREIVRAIKI